MCDLIVRFVASVATPNTRKPTRRNPPRFWLGPLIAGFCFAQGYAITTRLLIAQIRSEQPEPETFELKFFPGEPLETLRMRHGGTSAELQVDIAAREAELVRVRMKEKAARRKKEMQEALNDSNFVWIESDFIAPERPSIRLMSPLGLPQTFSAPTKPPSMP